MTQSRTANRLDAGHSLFDGMEKKKKSKADKDAKAKGAQPVQVGEHGRYLVKSGRLAGEYIARAFPKPPTKARGLIAEASGATEEAAIIALHEAIDARENRRTEDRRVEPETGASVPSTEEYVEALTAVDLTRPQRAMLTALALAETDGLSEAKIASAASYKSLASANRSLVSAGRLIATYLSSEGASDAPAVALDANAVLGVRGAAPDDATPGNWILHAELRDAVRATMDRIAPNG